ncbi:hypothetical protein K7X08_017375 [Anisodus acutangulus]|uniref:Laccase n=1 Tax=Anisodus acutangulus TaxID=402998 RepID=A0A9Q1LX88_9SOLA|nr:hypothetical protein K7X08_017375 [Anisodus acutangulus]
MQNQWLQLMGDFRSLPYTLEQEIRVQINGTNHAQYNMSIHWHGLKQYRNGWADGPVYITQCPIKTGNSFVYDFNVTGQRGEWWNADVEQVDNQGNALAAILIAPGQTTNVLVRTNQIPGRYFTAARPFMDAPVPVDNKTATAIFQYKGIPESVLPKLPNLPAPNDTEFELSYDKKLRSLNSPKYPANVPGVPTGGWTAIRFRADNPGVWFFHCHLELHTGWGLKTAFVVEDGPGSDHNVLPPPKDLPPC